MDDENAGYKEIEHTADWEIEVWAPDLSQLFVQAALGMYAISGIKLRSGTRQKRFLEIHAGDLESLLVCFLSELLFLAEKENLAFDIFTIEFKEHSIRAQMQGSTIIGQDKEIKAVTYHQLEVRRTEHRYNVNIVFDV